MAYVSEALREIPSKVSPQDHERLMHADQLDIEPRLLLYQEMIGTYSDPESLPFFLVRLGDLFVLLRSGTLALDQYHKAQSLLSSINIVDGGLDAVVEKYDLQIGREINETLLKAQQSGIPFLRFLALADCSHLPASYYQSWQPTNQHRFPTHLPQLPPGAQELKDRWRALAPDNGSPLPGAYLRNLVIETNQMDGVFLLSQPSIQDLVQNDLSDGKFNSLPGSAVQDDSKIKSILSATLEAYKLLPELFDAVDNLDKATICLIHSCIMKCCQIRDMHYIAPGKTRTETRKTVILSGSYLIECCPFPRVDEEIEYICKMSKQWIKSWRNPFATASWIHLVLVRCHPFEDGNGRLVRLLASIPLMRHGYPPISVALTQRADYYAAINQAYQGDHTALVQCMLEGMEETITSIQAP